MNKIYIPAKKPEDWKQFLADPKHWKSGHSAMALAYCWQEADGFPKSLKRVFKKSEIDLFQKLDILLATPEYQVPLPGGARPSQNGLFVLAKSKNDLITIMVEGKVSGSFGPLVSKWYKKFSKGKQKRLKFLCDILELEAKHAQGIRYQLLYRTASALIEAKSYNARNAIMLVHSFSQKNKWFGDYAQFLSMYGIDAHVNEIHNVGELGGINLYLGWVKGEKKYLNIAG